MKKRIGIAGIALIAFGIDWGMQQIVIIRSPSINPTLLVKSSITPKKGDYITFDFDDRYFNPETVKLTKKIACYAGDELRTEYPFYYCNDKLVATAMAFDGQGEALSHFEFNGIIPDGYALPLGDTHGSYDGRYWGFVELKNVTKVIPIL